MHVNSLFSTDYPDYVGAQELSFCLYYSQLVNALQQ